MGETSHSDDEVMAWQQTVANHGSWLRGLIAARLDPGEPVDDILQETMRSAIEGGAPAESLRDVKGWLAGIARNKVRQHIDRNCRDRKFQERVEELGAGTAGRVLPDPGQFLVDRERLALVQQALRMLPEDAAALLRGKYLHGWSYREIGARHGLNEDAVTNRLRHARRQLREALAKLSESPNEEES